MERTLNDADLQALAEIVKTHTACNLGLTEDEVRDLKKFVRADLPPLRKTRQAVDTAAGIIGKAIIYSIAAVLVAVMGKGFWSWLLEGLTKAKP